MKLYERILGKRIEADEKEVLAFGYDMLKTIIIGIVVALIISVKMGMVAESIVLLLLTLPLRQNAGGYHAPNRWLCALISLGIYVGALFMIQYVPPIPLGVLLLYIGGFLIIASLSPMGSRNKKLDEEELAVYSGRTNCILFAESMLFLVFFARRMFRYALVIDVAFLIVSLVLIAGKVDAWYAEWR